MRNLWSFSWKGSKWGSHQYRPFEGKQFLVQICYIVSSIKKYLLLLKLRPCYMYFNHTSHREQLAKETLASKGTRENGMNNGEERTKGKRTPSHKPPIRVRSTYVHNSTKPTTLSLQRKTSNTLSLLCVFPVSQGLNVWVSFCQSNSGWSLISPIVSLFQLLYSLQLNMPSTGKRTCLLFKWPSSTTWILDLLENWKS